MCLNIHFHSYFECIKVLISTTNASRNPFVTVSTTNASRNRIVTVYVQTCIKYVFVVLATPSDAGQW
jgi:hypothetical protein